MMIISVYSSSSSSLCVLYGYLLHKRQKRKRERESRREGGGDEKGRTKQLSTGMLCPTRTCVFNKINHSYLKVRRMTFVRSVGRSVGRSHAQ
jgi:hypothetical protein